MDRISLYKEEFDDVELATWRNYKILLQTIFQPEKGRRIKDPRPKTDQTQNRLRWRETHPTYWKEYYANKKKQTTD